MDQPTASPDAQDRPAASPDPVPTRPNPFDDDTNSARKRRRTSPVGSSSSLASDSVMDQTDDSPNADASAMNIDQNTSHPTTPDQGSVPPELAAQLSASRVTTINLRHHGGLDGAHDSPTTPSREPAANGHASNGHPRRVQDDQSMLDVQPDTRRDSFDSEGRATPASSTIATSSPEVDIALEPVDGIAAPGSPELTILGEQPAFDFARDFPFQGDAHHEPLSDVVERAIRFLESSPLSGTDDEDVIFQLLGWMNKCVGFFRRLDMDRTIACISGHQSFWLKMRDLVLQIGYKRGRYPAASSARVAASNFVKAATDVVAILVKTDVENLSRHRTDPNFADAKPILTSLQMLDAFATIVRQMVPPGAEDSPYLTLHEEGELAKRFLDADGGGLNLLVRLAQAQISLLQRHPQLADNLDYPSRAVAGVLSMSRPILPENHLPLPQQLSAAAKARLAIGLQYFDVVADCLSISIDKRVTHLSPFHTESLISSLSEMLNLGLIAGHDAAGQRLAHLHKTFPDVSDQYIVQMAGWEWRLGILCRLVKSSQMQLRVMAVRMICDQLIHLWKTGLKDATGSAFMKTLAQHLDELGIVDYVLDSTCHPEITALSGNIVGFIVVTGQYRDEHSDLMWRSITGAQDARSYDGLGRFVHTVLPMFPSSSLLYLLSKYQDLHIADMSNITVSVLGQVVSFITPILHQLSPDDISMMVGLLLRLLREASLLRPDSSVANLEVHVMAMERMRAILIDEAHADIRAKVLADCCADIASKSATTLGSMWCLINSMRPGGPASAVDLHTLTAEHDFPRIIIEELEHAAQDAPGRKLSTVLQRPGNQPRTNFISLILRHEAAAITEDLGMRLLDVLVGPKAISQDDREVAWRMLNRMGVEVAYRNPFLYACFMQYLPRLSPSHIHPGTLDFVRNILLRELNDPDASDQDEVSSPPEPLSLEDNTADGQQTLVQVGIEQLWRMLLSIENQNLAEMIVRTLVDDVYLGSKAIRLYPHHRARQVHLRVVDRCLKQLEVAAQQLAADNAPDAMPTLPDHTRVNERIFARSLTALQVFLTAYQSNALFSAPDLRSLMPQAPSAIQGEPADLKYQSFDGTTQTDVLPVVIGRQNTAASLLATLKEATGFDNYRLYYRGALFAPRGPSISKSLEDLHLTSGLLLVTKETSCATAPSKTLPGTSALEIEVLQHFPQLWSYLSMQNSLACQIYELLTSLPADSRILEMIESSTSTYQDILPRGEPYKCMYAIYALEMSLYMAMQPVAESTSEDGTRQDSQVKPAIAILRTRTLVADALADSDLLEDPEDVLPKHQLSSSLMRVYLQTLQSAIEQGETSIEELGTPAVDRLTELLCTGLQRPRYQYSLELIQTTFEALLLTSALSATFWAGVKEHPGTSVLIRDVLLQEQDGLIRQATKAAIFERCGFNLGKLKAQIAADLNQMAVPPASFREYFWQMLSVMIPDAARLSSQSNDFLEVVNGLARHLMVVERSNVLDIGGLVRQCCLVLQQYETSEVLGIACAEDTVLVHLLSILHLCFWTQDKATIRTFDIPPKFAEHLFLQHLFPRDRRQKGEPVPRTVLSTTARRILYEILQTVSSNDEDSATELARALSKVAPYDKLDPDFGYAYEMGWAVERGGEVRADCGYAGLRNLGNTCYMNSLMTQLFMNTSFRDFMINAPIHDEDAQDLLMETQKVFSYLQETNRRYVEPQLMVNSIKTYDEGSIDVSQQMDVDEFYNLLFDRWESQLPAAKERQTFRTFYGGQLVQQVSSKECEHISERLEPFSAIQCDVRGKRNLAASLQAYVDGEVMSGDNKYKCSKCDRHVDAVKRACLKDIPDNLIFHLKRFDFNLRTMLRSKINEHFAFPAQIDMRPYTIEQLSDPSQKLEEDMFELVGVLVHTGTAETGHYYSYIRERPTTRDGQTWLEFNDDSVTHWDHANMEEATFGTPPRAYEHPGFAYERSNNAYMLFYERSSALRAQQQAVVARQVPTPLKVDLPEEMFETIMNDNTTWLQRYCLYDELHMHFTLTFCNRILSRQPGDSANHERLERRAMQLLISLFDQAVTRTKSLSFLTQYGDALLKAVETSTNCALAFIQYFVETREPFRQLLQRNPDPDVRSTAAHLFLQAVRKVRSMDPVVYGLDHDFEDHGNKVADACLELFEILWSSFNTTLRSWPEVFGLINQFARLGDFEVALLLQKNWLTRAMMVIATDDTFGDLQEPFRKLNAILIRRTQQHTRPPSYVELIALIERLMSGLRDTVEDRCVDAEDRMDFYVDNPNETLPWCTSEYHILTKQFNHTGSVFVRRLLEVGVEVQDTQVIVRMLANGDAEMQESVLRVLGCVFRQHIEVYSMRPFLNAAHTCIAARPQDVSSVELIDLVARMCKDPGQEGGPFLYFLRTAHATLANHQDVRLPNEVLQVLPVWGPSLLGYDLKAVAHNAEMYIKDEVLPLDLDDKDDEDDDGQLAVTIAARAKELAVRCLGHLKRNYVGRHNTRESIRNLQSVIAHCEIFYLDQETGNREQLIKTRDDIYAELEFTLVEELDEEGSDWEHSVASSGALDSLADGMM